MQGQTAALSRVGITFDEAQEKVLKYGTETEKAAMLAKIITANVGEMNTALADTEAGQMKQLEMQFGAVKDSIGEAAMKVGVALLPVLEDLSAWLTKATQDVPGLIDSVLKLALAFEILSFTISAMMFLTPEPLTATKGFIGMMGSGTAIVGTVAAGTSVRNNLESTGYGGYGGTFATGGVLTEPTFGLMAEYSGAKTNPEIVTPQSLMYDTVSRAISDNMAGSNQGVVVNSVLKLDGQTIYRNQNKTKISRGYEFAGMGGFAR